MKHTLSPLRLIEGKRRFTVKTSVAAVSDDANYGSRRDDHRVFF
jgi:hypothetical protein